MAMAEKIEMAKRIYGECTIGRLDNVIIPLMRSKVQHNSCPDATAHQIILAEEFQQILDVALGIRAEKEANGDNGDNDRRW